MALTNSSTIGEQSAKPCCYGNGFYKYPKMETCKQCGFSPECKEKSEKYHGVDTMASFINNDAK